MASIGDMPPQIAKVVGIHDRLAMKQAGTIFVTYCRNIMPHRVLYDNCRVHLGIGMIFAVQCLAGKQLLQSCSRNIRLKIWKPTVALAAAGWFVGAGRGVCAQATTPIGQN